MTKLTVSALVTPQWRDSWDKNVWDSSIPNGEPQKAFLTFVMRASDLRKSSGVFRRNPKAEVGRALDDNVQRPHEAGRSREIRRFVEYGYPLSSMTPSQFDAADPSLQRPGWLPTAVVVNILAAGETRDGLSPLPDNRAVEVPPLINQAGGDVVHLSFSASPATAEEAETPPLEVIDGQHRLWAFEEDTDTDDYFLPVVAFVNLSKAHQAYLFWSINIKPKKINTSLAFDLYPILRSEEWLMNGEGLRVYRESRAQELTEALWATPASPWYDRINMIGATGVGETQPVSQASFVRSLLASFVKPWTARAIAGGLFGNDADGGLDWNRSQQAAFLIAAWQELVGEIIRDEPEWHVALASGSDGTTDVFGRFSLLASDQGVRAFLLIVNELSFRLRDHFDLRSWQLPPDGDAIDPRQVEAALVELDATGLRSVLSSLAGPVAQFDWRTTKAPGIGPEDARSRSVYRGSGGYVALRKDVYSLLAEIADEPIKSESARILAELAEVEAKRA